MQLELNYLSYSIFLKYNKTVLMNIILNLSEVFNTFLFLLLHTESPNSYTVANGTYKYLTF